MAKSNSSAPSKKATDTTPAAAASPGTENASVPGADAEGATLSTKGKPDPVIGLRIAAAREGFRRAGRAWSKTPIDVPLADLSDDQVAMLRAESMLTVEEVVLP
ncbi:MAG: HI1506-related protein [Betaproteobacteria bacterium]|nr:HI1506-related protein [Betaproteobacteria bacterium]